MMLPLPPTILRARSTFTSTSSPKGDTVPRNATTLGGYRHLGESGGLWFNRKLSHVSLEISNLTFDYRHSWEPRTKRSPCYNFQVVAAFRRPGNPTNIRLHGTFGGLNRQTFYPHE